MGAIARKEFIHLIRDPRMLIAVLVDARILQLLLFAYAISFDVRDVPTVVLDQDAPPPVASFVSEFEQSGFFRVGRARRVA